MSCFDEMYECDRQPDFAVAYTIVYQSSCDKIALQFLWIVSICLSDLVDLCSDNSSGGSVR